MDAGVNFDLQFDVDADLNRTMSEKTHSEGLTPLQLHSNLIPFLDIDENFYEVIKNLNKIRLQKFWNSSRRKQKPLSTLALSLLT